MEIEKVSLRDPLQREGSMFSIATAYAIDKLEELITTRTLNDGTLIAISVSTLLRNRLDADAKIARVIDGVAKELEVILDDITQLLQDHGYQRTKILFYLYDYSKAVHIEHQRPPTDKRKMLAITIDSAIIKKRDVFKYFAPVYNGVEIQVDIQAKKSKLHGILANKIKVNSREVLMLSHNPIDLHVQGLGIKVKLLRSHTGDVIDPPNFGKKIFKRDHIPFNDYTHILFGDKDYIKPSLGIKQKREITEIAEKENWELRSYNDVKVRIKRHGFLPSNPI